MIENLLTPHPEMLDKKDRQRLNQHLSAIIWFTGLSGSGKSTLAYQLESKLFEKKVHSYVLDGDHIRSGLNKDLSFSPADREENIRRVGEVARLFVNSGMIVITAFISPYRKGRNFVRGLVKADEFIEIYTKCPLEICAKRDVKGLYKKAKEGVIGQFTGISAPYEEPQNPEIIIETDKMSIEQSVNHIMDYLQKNHYLSLND
jgi:adenylylsulfate kinase